MFLTRSRKGRWHRILFVVPLFLSGGAGAANLEVSAERRDAAAQVAQSETRPIDISPQPLGDALRALSRQTGLQFFADSDLTSGITAPAVSGRMTADQALQRLLAGSGLTYRLNGSLVTVERATAEPESGPEPAANP